MMRLRCLKLTFGVAVLALTLVALYPSAHAGESAPAADANLLKILLLSSAEPDVGPAPLKVKFEVEVYEGDEVVKPQYEWDFDDGSPRSKEQNPIHVYKKPGEYEARVKVTDATGRVGRDVLPIEVELKEEAKEKK